MARGSVVSWRGRSLLRRCTFGPPPALEMDAPSWTDKQFVCFVPRLVPVAELVVTLLTDRPWWRVRNHAPCLCAARHAAKPFYRWWWRCACEREPHCRRAAIDRKRTRKKSLQ